MDALKWISVVMVSAAAGLASARFVWPGASATLSGTRDPANRPREAVADAREAKAFEAATAATSPAATSLPASRSEVPTEDGSASGEIARLIGHIRDLEAEVERLRAIVDERDPRHRRIQESLAANDLAHAALYGEILNLLLNDPEGVTDDPRHAFALLIQLVDETGLAAAPPHDRTREVNPEPNAPDLGLSLNWESNDVVEMRHPDPDVSFTESSTTLTAELRLPKSPEVWRGSPLNVTIHLYLRRTSLGDASLSFEVRDQWSGPFPALRFDCDWQREGSHFIRSPWRGGEDSKEGGRTDFIEQRRVVDDVFERLWSRAH